MPTTVWQSTFCPASVLTVIWYVQLFEVIRVSKSFDHEFFSNVSYKVVTFNVVFLNIILQYLVSKTDLDFM